MLLHNQREKSCKRKSAVKSSGSVNKLIDKLPVQLHIQRYRFFGPGTKFNKRIARPINKLDSFCQTHDLSYLQYKNSKNRSEVDQLLENQDLGRYKSTNASAGQKIAALGVIAVMKAKRKLGMVTKNSQPKKGKVFHRKRKSKAQKSIIHTPKGRGFLPLLLPIMGALGALGGGAAGIAKANEKLLAEMKRHILVLETEKKKGKALYLAPYKKYFK